MALAAPPAAQGAGGVADLSVARSAARCAGLAGIDLADIGGAGGRVTEAAETTSEAGVAACSVRGTLAPDITFAVVLPTETWTQRTLQIGCGGLCGRLSLDEVGAASGCGTPNAGGFAVAATDMGDGDGDDRAQDPQRRADRAHRAQHLTALASMRLLGAFHGQEPAHSTFVGCSDGGREALVAAQRHPDDFDGIVAGAPALNLQVQNTLYHGWQDRANRRADGTAILLADRPPVLHARVRARCDGLDGVGDGSIMDPLACAFDPATIRCEGDATAACLTAEEVAAAQAPRGRATRTPARGWWRAGPCRARSSAGPCSCPRTPGARPRARATPPTPCRSPSRWARRCRRWAGSRSRTERSTGRGRRTRSTTPPTPTCRRSRRRGAGSSCITAGRTRTSRRSTPSPTPRPRALMGPEAVDGFARLYLVPGMVHCSQGEGPYELDLLTPLMAWVEGGTAPDAVVARQPVEAEGSGFGQFGPSGPGGPPSDGAAEPLPGYPAPSGPSEADRARPL